jgi:hypothetical protein
MYKVKKHSILSHKQTKEKRKNIRRIRTKKKDMYLCLFFTKRLLFAFH